MSRVWKKPAAFLLLLLALAGALYAQAVLVQRDRAALVEQFAADREIQLERAARNVSGALEDVSDDVRFASELIRRGGDGRNAENELRALLDAVGKYKVIAVFGPDGSRRLNLVDPRVEGTLNLEAIAPALERTARQALARNAGEIVTSVAIDDDTSAWLRVIATAVHDENRGLVGSVAVVIDVAPLVAPLGVIAQDSQARLLVLGAHGRPLPSSSPQLAADVRHLKSTHPARSPLATLTKMMRSGVPGRVSFSPDEASAFGLPEAEAIGVYLPIPVPGGEAWSVASLSSTEPLRARDHALIARLVLVSALLAGLFAVLAVSTTLATRRAAELEESRHHAAQLAHLHELTQKILDNVPTGVLALSANLAVTSLNRVLQQRLRATVPGTPLAMAFPDAPAFVAIRIQQLVASALSSGTVESILAERVVLFGTEGHYNLHCIPLAQPEAGLRALLVVEDLSQLRALEDQLLHAEKLATVGVLAAGIAHEVGTPLGVVRGRAEYVVAKIGREHPQAANIGVIVEQIDRVSRTIGQLLDFARLEPAATVAVPLSSVFSSVSGLLHVEAERRSLHFECEEAPAVTVAADADQLNQVLVNLLLNAFDASKAGGAVTLACADSANGQVVLEVRDSGTGISEEHLHRIFDPFWTTKKRGQGTGLGLAIVSQIVRNHRGTIQVVSRSGHGTTIRVHWPKAGDDTPTAQA